jgi:hypothetical protein
VRWFTEDEIVALKHRATLHAGYELDAVRRLRGDILAAAS